MGAALRELGGAMARAFRALHARPVLALRDALAPELGPERTAMLLQPLQADLDLTEEWRRRLDAMAAERLSNDLLDRVKSNDLPGAEAVIAAMFGKGPGAQAASAVSAEASPGTSRKARMVGALLGGMIVEKQRAETLVRAVARNPQKFGLDFMAATDLEEEFARAQTAAVKRERPAAAVSRTELVQATVELGRALPQRMVIAEPNEEQIELFDRTLRALFRCALAEPGHERFHEVTLLLVEFSPKEVSTAGAMAGVEQRLFASLGRTARAVVAQGLKTIGHDPVAWPAYFAFARQHLHDKRIGRYATEALGLLANEEAVPFLISALSDRKAGVRTEAIFSLGTMNDPRAQSTLLATLEHDLRGRVVEGEARRDAAAIISALGRGVRAAGNPVLRDQVVTRVIRAIPKDETEFMVRAALNFFTGKLDGMNPELLEWAGRAATTALWSIDRPELARAGKAAVLGFRQPLIDLLGRLAPHVYPVINETALSLAKTYNGAYLAMAEFYGKNPDPRALPVLRQLLTNTFLHDDTKRSAYVKEQVLDVATEQRQDLDKDRVIAALVYAVDRIGGEEAETLLANVYEQIQAGRVERPGLETADILMKAHMKIARARTGDALPRLGEAAEPGGGARGAGAAGGPGVASAGAAQVTEDDLRHIADLEAGYLLSSKRRAKKVAAMAALGPRKVAAAAGVIVRHLTDKDPIIAAAALTAVTDMAAPPVAAPVLEELHRELLLMLESSDMDTRLKATEALARIGPRRSPLKEKLETIRARPDAPLALRSLVDKLLSAPGGGGGEASGAAGSADGGQASAAPGGMSELDKKRQYMLARQAWIRGGKRGPEPVMPE